MASAEKTSQGAAEQPVAQRRQEEARDAEKIDFEHDDTAKDNAILEEGDIAPVSGRRKKTDPVEISLVRKLDYIMLPMLWVMYFFNYLDRNAIAVARLDGLEKELNLSSTQYVTSVSILFVGYILGQIPSSESIHPLPVLIRPATDTRF